MATMTSLPDAVRKMTAANTTARGGTGENWISGAIRRPGALRASLGVPAGKKIPGKALAAAVHSKNPLMAKRARLAQTLRKLHTGRGR